MELTLSQNIRKLRKDRKMTQEQLAEVLSVTVGAVYKWESGLSVPELPLIVQMADFFDVSVDVLLGHRMKDNSADAIEKRLMEYCRSMNPEALPEAEHLGMCLDQSSSLAVRFQTFKNSQSPLNDINCRLPVFP